MLHKNVLKRKTSMLHFQRHETLVVFYLFFIFKFFLNSNTPTTLSLQQLFLIYFFFFFFFLNEKHYTTPIIQQQRIWSVRCAKTSSFFFVCKYFSNSRINQKKNNFTLRRKHGNFNPKNTCTINSYNFFHC